VRDEAVTSAPVTLTASEITAAQVALADAAFTDSDFETAARRYHNLYQATNDAALLVMEVISLLESGSLDAAFERDEDLQPRLDEVADADLLDRYEDAMAKAINAYMSVTP
jgi:anaerobic C4-dicarboxylate transporter